MPMIEVNSRCRSCARHGPRSPVSNRRLTPVTESPRPRSGLIGSTRGIWVFAALYFACYAPYTALTKGLSGGAWPGSNGIAGATLLPLANLSALLTLLLFLAATGLWRDIGSRSIAGHELPCPSKATATSGTCTAVILTTTTLAYTFDGVSIVFVMLLMRGGVLVMAPIIDAATGRTTRWFSWVGLLLALSGLVVAFSETGGYDITLGCSINIGLYLGAYFVRLRLMSDHAKSSDRQTTRRYFVEEQLVSTPLSVVALAGLALVGPGELAQQVQAGFTTHLRSGLVPETMVIGALSQGVLLFGSLVFLDQRENTFSVPVNRSVSILAGVLASVTLAAFLDTMLPSPYTLAGAGLVLLAISTLALGGKRSCTRASSTTCD